MSEPASRGWRDRPEMGLGHATEVKKTPRLGTEGLSKLVRLAGLLRGSALVFV